MSYDANSGYSGFSMSNRAVMAYEDGKMPKSKWTKAAILKKAEEFSLFDLGTPLPKWVRGLRKDVLADLFLVWCEWHHTSGYFNETDFYDVSEEKVISFLKEPDAQSHARMVKERLDESKTQTEDGFGGYLLVSIEEWGGSRKYPKRLTCERWSVKKNGWLHLAEESAGGHMKKAVSSYGVKVLRTQRTLRGIAKDDQDKLKALRKRLFR